ncbi:MAG: nucleotidyltransferase family protein [Elainellaceae cyanobacterium]
MSHGVSSQHSSQSQEALEQRRQIALHVAAESDRLLRDQFGATGVTVFGSLAGQSPWHWDSDIDLAVEGLDFEQWLAAVDAVRAIAPDWLSVDVVRLETLNPAVRHRVLQQHQMTQNKFLALKDHLDDEVRALDRCVQELVPAIDRAKERLESYDVWALASYINDFYRRCERMSERVAVALDGRLPQGANWHQALLRQVAEHGGNDRPPVWSGALLFDLDEYRRFRHVVHHKYGDELHPDYVLKLAELAPQMAPKIKEAIAHFNEWLVDQPS